MKKKEKEKWKKGSSSSNRETKRNGMSVEEKMRIFFGVDVKERERELAEVFQSLFIL
jgi:hypothetical protein